MSIKVCCGPDILQDCNFIKMVQCHSFMWFLWALLPAILACYLPSVPGKMGFGTQRTQNPAPSVRLPRAGNLAVTNPGNSGSWHLLQVNHASGSVLGFGQTLFPPPNISGRSQVSRRDDPLLLHGHKATITPSSQMALYLLVTRTRPLQGRTARPSDGIRHSLAELWMLPETYFLQDGRGQ